MNKIEHMILCYFTFVEIVIFKMNDVRLSHSITTKIYEPFFYYCLPAGSEAIFLSLCDFWRVRNASLLAKECMQTYYAYFLLLLLDCAFVYSS